MPKVVEDEHIITDAEAEGQTALEAEGTFGASWRIILFRAVRDGDLALVKEVCDSHPVAIHCNFTSGMKEWELQWESLRWYEFADCTALYLASSYCQDTVVEWLLSNGVDPECICYAKQSAIDVIGQCSRNQERASIIDKLLKQERRVPLPPVVPTCFVKIGYEDQLITIYEEVVNPEDPDGPKLRRPKRITETVVRCKISATYKSYWLPPKTPYELRCREVKSQEWKIERTQATHKIITGLLPDTHYEVQVRARNVAGWSDFGEMLVVKTPSSNKQKKQKAEKEEKLQEEEETKRVEVEKERAEADAARKLLAGK